MSDAAKELRDACEEELARIVTIWPHVKDEQVSEIAQALARNARRITGPDVTAGVTRLIDTNATTGFAPRPGDVVRAVLDAARARGYEPGRVKAAPGLRVATGKRCDRCDEEVLFVQSEYALYCHPCNTLQRVDEPGENEPRYRLNGGECGRVKTHRLPDADGAEVAGLIEWTT